MLEVKARLAGTVEGQGGSSAAVWAATHAALPKGGTRGRNSRLAEALERVLMQVGHCNAGRQLRIGEGK